MSKDDFTIAFLSSFTARGIADALRDACQKIGVNPSMYLGGYNQYVQEIIDPHSGLYKATPDFIILFLDTRAILGDHYFLPYSLSDDDRRRWVEQKAEELLSLVEKMKQNSSAKILLHNFEVPLYSPIGILEHKRSFGVKESIETLNAHMRDAFKSDARVFLFDFDAFCATVGKRHVLDHKMYYLGDMKLHMRHISDLVAAYLAYIKPMFSMSKKCIVLDLDDTVWGGVVGEDGIEGIKLGPTPEGRPYWELQKHLLALLHRGIILAINSKNNLEDAMNVFDKHPSMVLKREHIAAMRVNWEDKVANMRSLAEELNLGLDSFVFFDDDKANRAFVRAALPEVLVVELPDDPALYVKTLTELDAFHTLQLTEEDFTRATLYAQERQRKEFSQTATDLTEYLRGLSMEVTIENANAMTIPRIAQLTQKTNQFNMTTRRYAEEEIRQLVESGHFMVLSLHVKDAFGDSGVVGVAIVEKRDPAWRIDTFLLSCRVIGRGIENALLAYIVACAKHSGTNILCGAFIPTRKNAPAKGFYVKSGFVKTREEDDVEQWEYDLKKEYPYPEFITVLQSKLL